STLRRMLASGESTGCRDTIVLAHAALGRLLALQRRRHAAVEHFERAEALAPDAVPYIDYALPAAWLALLGRRRVEDVTLPRPLPVQARAEAHWVLYRASGDVEHLGHSRRLLDAIAERLDEPSRATFWANVPLARRVRREAVA